MANLIEKKNHSDTSATLKSGRNSIIIDNSVAAPAGNCKFLIIEDNLDFLHSIITLFDNSSGIHRVAITKDRAFEHLKETDFDLIIFDLDMPGMDENALNEFLIKSEHLSQVPLILLTRTDTINRKDLKLFSTRKIVALHKPLQSYLLMSKIISFIELPPKDGAKTEEEEHAKKNLFLENLSNLTKFTLFYPEANAT